jgi:hypothetical protein
VSCIAEGRGGGGGATGGTCFFPQGFRSGKRYMEEDERGEYTEMSSSLARHSGLGRLGKKIWTEYSAQMHRPNT